MPVYRNHRVTHLHIPKTAGTSLETQFADLGDMHWNNASWYGRSRRPDRWYEDHHLSLCELRELSLGEFMSFDTFAVVRNPYQRLISEHGWRHHLVYERDAPDLTGFESFDALVAAIPLDLAHNWSRYMIGGVPVSLQRISCTRHQTRDTPTTGRWSPRRAGPK